MPSKLELFCKALMEAAWLAAAAVIPLFFSISSTQTFEPDKMFVLKFLVVLALAAWLLARIAGGRPSSGEPFSSFLRKPLVLPVLALAAIYLLSSIFSITPALSWWGSYKRAQGTIAFFCYAILFLILLAELRSSIQLKRLQFVFILTSIPVAAYPILQHFGADPLPWSELIGRASGSMGNPIFLGGYLVMVIPLTFFRVVEGFRAWRSGREPKPAQVLVCCCSLALALQLAALLCTQSRGPVLGLAIAGYFCAFAFFLLNRNPRKDRSVFPVAAAGLGIVVPLLVTLIARAVSVFSAEIALACLAGTIGLMVVVYFRVWHASWGRTWFWLTWLTQSITLVFIFAVFPAGVKALPPASSLGRLAQISGGSVDVRKFLWEIGARSLRSGPSSVLPDGTHDSFYFVRSVLGYGPECAWMNINLYASPQLVKAEEHESADRMHNETLDNLVTLGFAGSLAYLVILASGLFYSLHCLGFDCSGPRKWLFLLLSSLGSLAGVLAPLAAGTPYLVGIGVELGLLCGVFAFVAWNGFRPAGASPGSGAAPFMAFGILGALIAHMIEAGVGIAVTPTRVYFYLVLGIVSVLSIRDLTSQEGPAKSRNAKAPAGWFQSPLLAYAAIVGLAVLVESWCFTFNAAYEQSAAAIFLQSWFTGQGAGIKGPGAFVLLLLTVCSGAALMYSEKPNGRLERYDFRKILISSSLVAGSLWIVMGCLSAFCWTTPDSSSPLDISRHSEARMTIFITGLLLLLTAAALAFMRREDARQKISPVGTLEIVFGMVLAACAVLGIWQLTLRPAWADVACRIAGVYESSGNPAAAAQLYTRASELAPWVIPYRLSLGLARSAAAVSDPGQASEASRSFEAALALNRLDPEIYRALGKAHMQAGERTSDPAIRTAELKSAISFLQKASLLAPNYPDAFSETGRCFFLLGDFERANALYDNALRIDPAYSRTYMFIGEMHYRQKNLELALKSFAESARLDGKNIEARKNVGFLLALLGRRQEAIHTNLDTLKQAPRDPMLLTRLAALYFSTGDYSAGLAFARQAYEADPSGKGSLDEFIEKLKDQAK